MKPRFAIAAMAACLAVVASSMASAAESLVDKLGEQPVTVPIPAGFGQAEGVAGAVRDVIARAIPPNYRVISMQVSQNYLDKLRAHEAPGSMSRYVVVLTYRDYETSGMTQEVFDGIKRVARDQSQKMLKLAEAQSVAVVDKMNEDLAQMTGDPTATVKLGATTSLGVFEERPNALALATIGPVSGSSKKLDVTHDQVWVTALVLIHGKPINANFYSDYDSKDDLDWTENQAREWIRRVNELNP